MSVEATVKADDDNDEDVCRIMVVGGHRARVAKVMSILRRDNEQSSTEQDTSYQEKRGSGPQDKNNIRVDYVPCVATFDSYKDDEKGVNVRYLVSVQYCGSDGTDHPSSLQPLFDQEILAKDDHSITQFPGIAGVAIGIGVEGQEDTDRIQLFLETMLSGMEGGNGMPTLKCIEANYEYSSMKEELAAYRALSPEEKEEATRTKTMGPGKMAKFIAEFTTELVATATNQSVEKELSAAVVPVQPTDTVGDPSNVEPSQSAPSILDIARTRFSCRKCRTVLFGESDLEDPPHEPSRHKFSYRKLHHGACTPSSDHHCQSYFLQTNLDWMGPAIESGVSEGKFSCPSCGTKLGTWTWSGAQCSCGSWVAPAIQIPKSKVDVVAPREDDSGLPPGTIVSPILRLQQHGLPSE